MISFGVCSFADDVVLVDESMVRVNRKLELWRRTLELKGFRLIRNTRRWFCGGSEGHMIFVLYATRYEGGDVSLDGQVVVQKDTFRYLGSVLQKDATLMKMLGIEFQLAG